LLFTTKMLASTVKFSRCGRVRVSSQSCEGAGQPAAEGGCSRNRTFRAQQRA